MGSSSRKAAGRGRGRKRGKQKEAPEGGIAEREGRARKGRGLHSRSAPVQGEAGGCAAELGGLPLVARSWGLAQLVGSGRARALRDRVGREGEEVAGRSQRAV